ncbi:Serine/threonine-protein kinase PknA [Planktothrix tepida]|uniref:Serine/threonine protein kinase n=1 Tax=Planktothrix tepida PCC 9214 TaxID=671072 RepID=A0A1J1LGZ8_9CYAN|nr:serine/threonine-protein kinase [Planktothrix tepida]CAD5929517.1 Serine/threonine-protein kinase PknA [Planktothrix tepida]CUR31486.1 Serine/threonine protein kinase [Planktothrix tepida PCC 9214]
MLNSGQIIQDRYQLQSQCGRTATGRQTWLAIDRQTQEKVIIKLLAFSPQMAWEELKLFEREAQVLQALNHPRIPHYRDYFSLDQSVGGGLPWFGLVQDYIPGSSLQDLLDQGHRFTESQVKKIAKDILKILIYLHELSPPVLHRDIKPSNLILDDSEQIYLVDFGAVQAQASVTGVTFTVVGTSGYAPLEQFWGRAVAASDLYALGATLIHLLTNTFPADLPQKEARIHFQDRISLNPNFVHWIEQITEISLEKRLQTSREALELLKAGKIRPQKNQNMTPQRALIKKLNQPFYSTINVDYTPEHLKIYLPPKGFGKLFNLEIGCSHLLILYFGFGFFLSICIPMFLSNPLLFWFLCSLLFVSGFLWIFFLTDEKTWVEFDHTQFRILRKSRGIQYRLLSASLSDIIGVFMEKKRSKYEIVIRTTSQTYRIGEMFVAEECAWLTQKIQDWLYPH